MSTGNNSPTAHVWPPRNPWSPPLEWLENKNAGFYRNPLKTIRVTHTHKFPTKKCCFQEKCVCVFDMFFFLLLPVSNVGFSQWWTLKPNQTSIFFGENQFFFLLLVDGVFHPNGKHIRPSGRVAHCFRRDSVSLAEGLGGPAVLDWSIRESCRFPKLMVGPMGGGVW